MISPHPPHTHTPPLLFASFMIWCTPRSADDGSLIPPATTWTWLFIIEAGISSDCFCSTKCEFVVTDNYLSAYVSDEHGPMMPKLFLPTWKMGVIYNILFNCNPRHARFHLLSFVVCAFNLLETILTLPSCVSLSSGFGDRTGPVRSQEHLPFPRDGALSQERKCCFDDTILIESELNLTR